MYLRVLSGVDLVPVQSMILFGQVFQNGNVVINNGMGDVVCIGMRPYGIGCVIIGPVTLHKHVGLS